MRIHQSNWIEMVLHPAGTSIVSDICDLSNISDIAPLTLGSMEKSFLPLILCHTGNLFE